MKKISPATFGAARFLLMWAILLAPVCLLGEDRVFPEKGILASGQIKEITPSSVTITVRGKDQVYAMSDVRKISFDGEPNTLDRARENVIQGQYEQALEEVKKISTDGIANPLVRQDVEFYRHYSEGQLGLAGNGDKQAAIKGLLALANSNPKTHHLYDLSELLGELAVAVGQPDQAVRYFNLLRTAPNDTIKANGVYRLGEVELSQGKHEEARVRFEQLTQAPSTSPELVRLKSLAEVGLAVCDHLAGNTQRALDKLNSLVAKHDSTDHTLFAKINNAKGACFQALEQPNRALLSYLQTDRLFFTHAEAHAEALYHLSKLWPLVGEGSRAAEAKERLVAQYASTTWAEKP